MSFPTLNDLLPRWDLFKPVRILLRALAGASSDGLTLENDTPATAVTPVQKPPRIRLAGGAWGTTGAANVPVEIILEAVPSQSATGHVDFEISAIIDGGSPVLLSRLSSSVGAGILDFEDAGAPGLVIAPATKGRIAWSDTFNALLASGDGVDFGLLITSYQQQTIHNKTIGNYLDLNHQGTAPAVAGNTQARLYYDDTNKLVWLSCDEAGFEYLITTYAAQTLLNKTLGSPVITDAADFHSDSIMPVRVRAAGDQLPEISLESSGNTIASPTLSADSVGAGAIKFKVRETAAANLKEIARISGLMNGNNSTQPPGMLVFYVRAPGGSLLTAYATLDDKSFSLGCPLALPQLASAPAAPQNGWCYYDSTLAKGRIYEASAWRDI